MKARSVPYQLSGTGEAHTGLFDDISTRNLQSVSVGEGAGKISIGSGNAFVGFEAGKQNTEGAFNTMVGYQAGATNIQSSFATMVGAYAGAQHLRGSEVTFVGYRAGELSQDGNNLVGIGAYALRENTRGNGTVAVGYRAGERTLDGYFNTLIGTEAGQDNRSGNFNTMAGYRAGRGSFLGNENTYFGAFAGYCNQTGDGNCFVGYKSGENLADGSFNVALGVASMQSVSSGSCNVAIGPFAGAFGKGNAAENVMIGANVGQNAAPSRSVLVGAYAACNLQGTDSVVIGYRSAPTLQNGSNNIVIGVGADTLFPSTKNAVVIGSTDAVCADQSIGVGNLLVNRGQYSVMVGYDLTSDTDNSVVLGNRNTIESVVFFKDPISEPLKSSVLADGSSKLGISALDYSQMTISPCNEIYPYAYAGIVASNITQSINNPSPLSIGPASYDLRHAVPHHVILSPRSFPIWNSSTLSSMSMSSVGVVPTSSFVLSSNVTTLQCSSELLKPSDIWLQKPSGCNLSWSSSSPSDTFAANITFMDVQSVSATIYAPSVGASPRIHGASNLHTVWSNVLLHTNGYIQASPSPLKDIFQITPQDSSVPIPNAQLKYVVTESPQTGRVANSVLLPDETISVLPWEEYAFATSDQLRIRPFYEFSTNEGGSQQTSNGIISPETATIQIQYAPSNTSVYSANGIFLGSNVVANQNYTFHRELFAYPANSNTYVRFKQLDDRFGIRFNNRIFNSQDVARMVAENVWDYPPGAFSSFVSVIPPWLQLITTCNVERAQSLYPILDDICTDITSIIDRATGFPNADLSNAFTGFQTMKVASLSPVQATKTLYETSTGQLVRWINVYDPLRNIFEPFTQRCLEQTAQYESQYFTNNFWVSWSNTQQLEAIYTRSAPIYDSASNQLQEGTQQFHQTTVPLLSSFNTFPIAEQIWPTYSNIYHKYNVVPRLFPAVPDFEARRVSLAVLPTSPSIMSVSPSIIRPIEIQYGNDVTCNILISFGTNQTWVDSSLPALTNVLPSSSYQSHTSSVRLPHLITSDWFVVRPPAYGILSFATSTNATRNLSNATYIPFDMWASTDTFELVTFAPGAASGTALQRTFEIRYDDTIRALPFTLLVVPRETVDSTPPEGDLEVRSIVTMPFFASNITHTVRVVQDVALPAEELIEHIPLYNPQLGYTFTTSNIFTCNVVQQASVLEGEGVIVYHSNYQVIKDVYSTFTEPILTLSNVFMSSELTSSTPVPNLVEPNITSNIYWFERIYTCTSNFKAFTSNLTVLDRVETTTVFSNILPPQRYIYHNTQSANIDPPVSNLEVVEATSSTLAHTNTYLTQRSNSTVYDSFAPLTRAHISARSQILDVSVFNTDAFEIVEEGKGPVTRIDLRYPVPYWGRYTGTTLTTSCNVVTTVSHPPTQQIIPWSIHTARFPFASLVQEANYEFTLDLDPTTYRASFLPVLQSLLETLPFVAENMVVRATNHGVLLKGDRIITVLTSSEFNDTDITYQSCRRQTSDTITVFFARPQQGQVSNILHVLLKFRQSPVPEGQSWNLGLQRLDGSILNSNLFHHADENIAPEGLVMEIENVPGDGTMRFFLNDAPNTPISSFTQAQVQQGAVRAVFTGPTQGDVTYRLRDAAQGTVLISANGEQERTFRVRTYYHDAFWRPSELTDAHIEWRHIRESSNVLYGTWWRQLETLFVQNVPISPSLVRFHLTSSLSRGFLWNKEQNITSMVHNFTLDDVYQNKMRYIPFRPGVLSNETLSIHMKIDNYTDSMSPLYHIPWKNYVVRFPSFTVNSASMSPIARRTGTPILSAGLLQDGYSWNDAPVIGSSFVNATVSVSRVLSNFTRVLWQGNIDTARYIANEPFQQIQSPTNQQIVVDEADSVEVPRISVTCNVAFTQDQYVYLISAPLNGIIQHAGTGETVARWTDAQAARGEIIYQHLGGVEQNHMTDVFKLAVASSPFTLSCNEFNVYAQIRPMPKITANAVDSVFHNSAATASNQPNPFSWLRIDRGYIHVLSSNHIASFKDSNGNVATILEGSRLSQSAFTLAPSILTPAFDGKYPTATMTFAMNNRSSSLYVNRLSSLPAYRPLFVHDFKAQLNHHQDSNLIRADVSPNQVIRYTIDPSQVASSNLDQRTVAFSFQVLPRPSYVHPQNDFAHSERLQFRILGVSESEPLLSFDIMGSSWTLSTATHPQIFGALPSRLTQYTWNTIRVVNNDPNHDNNLAVYWNYTTTEETTTELLSVSRYDVPSLNLLLARSIEINTNVYDTSNLLPFSSIIKPVGNGTIQASFDFLNTFTSFFYRNFEITYTTYRVGEVVYDSSSHNLVVGKSIFVRGINNICLGNRFATSGQRSIIFGNNIGTIDSTSDIVDAGGVNDIYQSIIIGNDSFKNSIVRDVICVGNENLNNLASAGVQQVQNFISYKPIIIGNNIDASMLDFHINVGNQFLFTSEGGDQVYLGMGGRPSVVVGIGYSSNARLSHADGTVLHVSGGVRADSFVGTRRMWKAVATEPIENGMLVSEAPVTTSDGDTVYVHPSKTFKDPLVVGISFETVGSAGSHVSVQVSGRCRVWCDSLVTPGDLLVAGAAALGVATRLSSRTLDPERVAFGRSLSSWDPNNPFATPSIETREQGNTLQGYIWCSLFGK